jgi:hypothetical protein
MKNIKIYEQYVYGTDEIRKIQTDKNSDVWLEDNTDGGNLRGEKVSTLEYAIRMLQKATKEENWSTVENTILYLKNKQSKQS